jgi:cold shock CspA family protein
LKIQKGVAKVLWFNCGKGYGEAQDEKTNEFIFLYGQELGGDMFGMEIPKNKMLYSGDRIEYTAEKQDRPIFPTSPKLIWRMITCKKI